MWLILRLEIWQESLNLRIRCLEIRLNIYILLELTSLNFILKSLLLLILINKQMSLLKNIIQIQYSQIYWGWTFSLLKNETKARIES